LKWPSSEEKTMLIRIITLRFSAALDGFDDSPLTEFIKDKSVVSLKEHFFIRNETPYLAVVVIYEPVLEMPPPKTGKPRQQDESWRALLSDADMPLFDSLRSWRGERCKKEGIPPYVICNNKELAKIAVARPQSLSQLMQVEGFGKGKADKYGEEMLALLKHDDGTATDG
jgi:superfamily II DNA helicase RecQ